MSTEFAAIGWTTTPTEKEATELSEKLLDAGLVACAQISAPMKSHYLWEGKRHIETEYRITLKFLEENASLIETWLEENHSYEVPQGIWVRASGISNDYHRWMTNGS